MSFIAIKRKYQIANTYGLCQLNRPNGYGIFLSKGGDFIASVTSRIKEVKQPRGGYVKLSDFETIALSDGKELNADENIHATLIGMAVDYLTRIELGEEKESAFHVSLRGATLAEGFGMTNASDTAQKLLKGIKGLDKKSITNACKLSSFDVWVRNFMGALMAKTYK